VVVPHLNWRGLFGRGTDASGNATTIEIEWPGFQTTAYHTYGQTQAETRNWMGSLLEGQRDAGGQMYMRNRYYDPATGQFTQPDPIGIAGGLNVYGFAAGDPVSYSDPYGLCPDCDAFWMEVAAAGLARGGFRGRAQATVALAAATALEFFGVNDLWRAGDQVRDGQPVRAAGTAALAIFSSVPAGRAVQGTKAAVRASLGALDLNSDVTRAANRLIRDFGRAEQVGVEVVEGGGAVVHRFVAGADGSSSAVYTYCMSSTIRGEQLIGSNGL
jgi:RHS repeat-associated protein